MVLVLEPGKTNGLTLEDEIVVDVLVETLKAVILAGGEICQVPSFQVVVRYPGHCASILWLTKPFFLRLKSIQWFELFPLHLPHTRPWTPR